MLKKYPTLTFTVIVVLTVGAHAVLDLGSSNNDDLIENSSNEVAWSCIWVDYDRMIEDSI